MADATSTSGKKQEADALEEVRERFATLAPEEFFDQFDDCAAGGDGPATVRRPRRPTPQAGSGARAGCTATAGSLLDGAPAAPSSATARRTSRRASRAQRPPRPVHPGVHRRGARQALPEQGDPDGHRPRSAPLRCRPHPATVGVGALPHLVIRSHLSDAQTEPAPDVRTSALASASASASPSPECRRPDLGRMA